MKIVVKLADIGGDDDVVPALRPHYYIEVADNGETISVSEVYATRSNALRAAKDKARLYAEHVRVENGWREEA